jgi:hypothetical protein
MKNAMPIAGPRSAKSTEIANGFAVILGTRMMSFVEDVVEKTIVAAGVPQSPKRGNDRPENGGSIGVRVRISLFIEMRDSTPRR